MYQLKQFLIKYGQDYISLNFFDYKDYDGYK